MEDKKKKDVDFDDLSDFDEEIDIEDTKKSEKSKDFDDDLDFDDEELDDVKPKKEKSSKSDDDDDELMDDEKQSIGGKIVIALIIIAIIVILLLKACTGGDTKYTVKFDTNGGSNVSSITVKKDGTISKPTDPTREGYVFEGWYYNGELFDFNTKITGDITLEARWSDANAVATGVSLNREALSLQTGQSTTLEATISPKNGKYASLTWTSSDSSIVTVDENGKVTALKAGEATITVTVVTEDGQEFTATCTVTVADQLVPVTGITVDKTSVTINVGSSTTLRATVQPENATNKNLKWTSSNSSVASVNSKGVVTGKKEGKATITVTTEDGSYTATIEVTVRYVPVTGITLNPTSKTIKVGETTKITANVQPSNASNKKVSWTSSDPSKVTVDGSGKCKRYCRNWIRTSNYHCYNGRW